MKIQLALIISLISSSAFAQQAREVDILATFDAAKHPVKGQWSRTDNGIRVEPAAAARTLLATGVPDDYQLTVEFTRVSGEDSVAVIIPVGTVSPALELSGWQGQAHGLSRVDGLSVKDSKNPTGVRPGTLSNGKRHKLEVTVQASASPLSVSAKLDGKPLFAWQGEASRLQPNLALNVPTPRAIGLAAHQNEVVFHRVTLESIQKPAPSKNSPPKTTSEPSESRLAALQLDKLDAFNGAAFETGTEDGKDVLRSRPSVGTGDRGAWLKSVTFSEGTIEIDLKGAAEPQSSFLGIAFHGVDGKTYDTVYFRPFNFGISDPVRRSHAIQYMSHPDYPWAKLRAERNGEFESTAQPEPKGSDWFRAKIEVRGRRIRVFVNGSEKPSLDVLKLSGVNSGKVGLWFNGTASFANLKIQSD
ncbi:MAG: DUF1080 domain-containing protein [Planctomycetota bacterium]|nr:DUF1080 domain-containing protein [Planctomycetota bacterium]